MRIPMRWPWRISIVLNLSSWSLRSARWRAIEPGMSFSLYPMMLFRSKRISNKRHEVWKSQKTICVKATQPLNLSFISKKSHSTLPYHRHYSLLGTTTDSKSRRLCNSCGLLCFTIRRKKNVECGSQYTHKKVFI